MNPEQLLTYIIHPTLRGMGEKYAAREAEILLLATAATESNCGEYIHQVLGPALGIYQCEPATHGLIRKWCKERAPGIFSRNCENPERLIYDLRYATKIARMLYYSWPDPLPAINSSAMYAYYKEKYNSRKGKATWDHFRDCWNKYVYQLVGYQ